MSWLFKDPVLLAVALGTGLPLLSMAVILIFTRANTRLSCSISISAVSVSFICAAFLLARLFHAGAPVEYQTAWLLADEVLIPFGYLLDPLSLLMLMIVATISLLVQIYSLGYMAGDPGFTRYYAFQSLFAWAMMNMVIAPSMFQLFIFWELVGLASYLLIGFYYEKYSASQAGKKAFVMTRFADLGFLMGLLILVVGYGNLNILDLCEAGKMHLLPNILVTVSGLLIFCGVIGKSAQFPLLTWLPDAMEGPTPVSALLHSATMVAAGVYMFSRIFPFFASSPDAMTVALTIGTVTMLLASTMAMATYDLKQVWAYSTVSQLGFMVMGLAAGGYFAGVFHLTTHAGFKALLFLCSGIFIHEYHTNDMRIIGKQGGRNLRIPIVCMSIGALALSGVFPFSGFFSKEAILGALANSPNKIWLFAGLLGALMTAYYSFRLIFFVVFPKGGIEEHPAHHGEEAHGHEEHGGEHHGYIFWCMAVPVMVLASVTVVLGFFQSSLEHFLMGPSSTVQAVAQHAAAMHEGAEGAHAAAGHGAGHYILLFTAVGCALTGILWAWMEFGKRGAEQKGFLYRFPRVEELFARRWYMDDFLRKSLDNVVYGGLTNAFTRNDRRVIDGGIDGICFFTVAGGRLFSFLQSGMLQYNLLVMVAAVGLVVLYFLI
ncbi:NADH-quinone oxidoreductase subunit 5 family protein [Desulforhabdus amnigena]|jgi:NADH-quinone oxidoreductase subunit L|uniref:NADH-quinone oxidoreductase subunit L n=1 Tax=Desulforhabdus amnigena TaxID=40218 RepID=A0A9W6D5C5_9BACT|nr:NADH-quinone oxidoreductase subunit L [Desulforhabdus amnigena]NLJ26909.1 NADH-quinone oxidoreductase subunit L [Deltaproteobacteria bacterium]GLI34497.1 NADH-quinone oxidoreductase subunit L [Desulforhabdus amnigena]